MKTAERLRRGLNEEEVLRSRREHGENRFTKQKQKGFLAHFFSNLGDPVIRILLCALGVNLFFVFRGGDPIETVGIAVSSFWQRWYPPYRSGGVRRRSDVFPKLAIDLSYV